MKKSSQDRKEAREIAKEWKKACKIAREWKKGKIPSAVKLLQRIESQLLPAKAGSLGSD